MKKVQMPFTLWASAINLFTCDETWSVWDVRCIWHDWFEKPPLIFLNVAASNFGQTPISDGTSSQIEQIVIEYVRSLRDIGERAEDTEIRLLLLHNAENDYIVTDHRVITHSYRSSGNG